MLTVLVPGVGMGGSPVENLHGILKMYMSNDTWVPILLGPTGGVTDGNKVQFDGTSGGLVKDAGTT